jgi:transposase
MVQLHKKFTCKQVGDLIVRYLAGEIEREYIQEILGIGKTRFFALVKKYRKDPENFSIEYRRKKATRKIPEEVEDNIMKELKVEKELITDPEVPLRSYNYSYIADRLTSKYGQKVSTPTIINRAKREGFYLKKPKRKAHDREVLTNYAGELIQHDSSHHKFSPYTNKWYLITSIDDCSRYLLYYRLIERETSWTHIEALEDVALKHGLAYSYYVDSHSIFRFVQGRDSFWRKHYKVTDEADPQWKQVLDDLRVKLIYALSAAAKGKIERPYRWLQDRIVRTCAREGIDNIADGNKVLEAEAARYNFHQRHSVTGEVPYYRLKRLLGEGKTLFREFVVPAPYKSTKDIFALRGSRVVNPYRKISFNRLVINIAGVPIRDSVSLRIVPDLASGMAEIRFWYKNEMVGTYQVRNEDLNLPNF